MIRFENVDIQFDGNYLFKNLTFDVKRGEKFLIYGESGIGKTTIFRLLLGFESPQVGMVYFDGRKLDVATVWDVRRRVAYVSQDVDIGSGTVLPLIYQAFSYRSNRSLRVDEARVREQFKFFRLKTSILHEDFEQLSGGEKQRIAIIIAILLERDIFFLDEATSSLDVELKHKVIQYFVSNREWTVLAISHDEDWLGYNGLKVLDLNKHNADP
jgi:putative ABC transport system ATP-binding protein